MKSRQFLAFSAILVCSLVLRPPLAGIGPLLPEISDDLGLSTLDQALLSSTPVFAFGAGAFVGPWFTKRFGNERSMVLLLSLLVLSMLFRGWWGFGSLLIGTLTAGLAIAVSNVLLPAVVRDRFPTSIAKVTAAYTAVLAISASFAAASAVPASDSLGGWNAALLVWLLPSLVAVGLWARLKPIQESSSSQESAEFTQPKRISVTRSVVTWALFTFFGIQSLGFYVILAWLPTLLIDRGFSADQAGGLLGLATIVGVPFGLALGSYFGKMRRLDWAGFLISCVTLAGFALLLVRGLETYAAVLIGLGQASTFPLSLTLISTSARDAQRTTAVSAFVQGGGYLLSAAGIFAFSSVKDFTGNWANSILLIIVLTAIQAVSSFAAGGSRKVD